MATYTHDVMATVGTYKKDGEDKKRYVKCGAAFTHDESGNISIKMDSVPVSPEWSGWLSLFEKKEYDQQPAQGNRHQQGRHPLPQGGATTQDVPNDDVPF